MPRGVHNSHRSNSGSFNNWTPEQRADLYQKRSQSKKYQESRPNTPTSATVLCCDQQKATEGKRRSEVFKANNRQLMIKLNARLRASPEMEQKRLAAVADGLRRTHWGRTKSTPTTYNNVRFRSFTEASFARWCDLVGWAWVYEPCVLPYVDEDGVVHRYIPDFYILGEDMFFELKGWKFQGLQERLDMIARQNNVMIEVLVSHEVFSLLSQWPT